MSIKHLLISVFFLSSFILGAQEPDDQSELYTVMMTGDAEFIIKNLKVNSENQDFGTVYYKDKIVFASTRPSTKFIRRVWNLNDLPFLDLFVAGVHNAELIKTKPFSKNINNKFHEGPASFNEEGTFMAFTRNNYEGKSQDDIVKLQLFTSEFVNGEWSVAKPVRFNSNEYSVGHPSLTADGNTMYFASDMPGGYGGVDIYVTTKNEKGEWSDAMNLGEMINTAGNEMFPFIYNDNFLFFASTGHTGLGGLDLFFSRKAGDHFTEPKNIGSPINSNKDDFAFILNKAAERGYFSSNRDGGKGDDDIYSFILIKPTKKEISFKGKVLDAKGNNLTNTFIVVYDGNGNQINVFEGDESGEFNVNIQPEVFYRLEVKKENFETGELEIFSNGTDSLITHNLVLERIYNYILTFHVSDQHTKERIDNAKISFIDKLTGWQGETYTDDNGIAVLTPEKYKINDPLDLSIELSKEGYFNKSTYYKTVLQQEESMDIEVELLNLDMKSDTTEIVAPPVEILITGKVVDNKGNEIPNTNLTLYDSNGNQVKSVKSNSRGDFSFTVDRNKMYKLEGIKEKFEKGSIAIDTHSDDLAINKDLTMSYIPVFNLICSVKDSNTKQPISGINIKYEDLIKGIKGDIETDPEGRAVINIQNYNLEDKLSYSFLFKKEGYIDNPHKYNTTLLEEGDYFVEIAMHEIEILVDTVPVVINTPVDILLKGKVTDNAGNPVVFATIKIDDGKGNIIEVKTDESGNFKQLLKPDSEYKIECFKEKYIKEYTVINTDTKENEIIKDWTLKPVPEFYVVYSISDIDTKEALSDVQVYYESIKTGVKGNSVSDARGQGSFKTEGFQLNEKLDYKLKFKKESYEEKSVALDHILEKAGNYYINIELKKIVLPDTTHITVLPPSVLQIIGKVLDTENLTLTGAKVSLYDHTGKFIKHVYTDEKGAFSLEHIPGGTYKLEAVKDKYHAASTTIESNTNDTLVSVNLFLAAVPEPVYDIQLTCIVKDKATNTPVKDTKVTLINKFNGEEQVLHTSSDGKIAFTLRKLKLDDQIDYSLIFENEAYSKKTVDYKSVIKKADPILLNVELQKFEIGEDLSELPEMNPIYFDYDKFSIREDAAIELDKIVKIMNDYPNLEIVLSAYTDCRGTSNYNLDLSNKRVKATAEYIKKRISMPQRISGKGFGETNLVNDCDCDENNPDDCTEDQHQQNRRTEFKVIKK